MCTSYFEKSTIDKNTGQTEYENTLDEPRLVKLIQQNTYDWKNKNSKIPRRKVKKNNNKEYNTIDPVRERCKVTTKVIDFAKHKPGTRHTAVHHWKQCAITLTSKMKNETTCREKNEAETAESDEPIQLILEVNCCIKQKKFSD